MNRILTNIYNSAVIPYHWFQGFRAANHYDYPASAMTVIGVTGTNGKTSTCYMIYNTLLKAGLSVGLSTTVGDAINGEIHEEAGHMTTASPAKLNKLLAKMRDAKVNYLVLEVSSHALAQGRIFGVPIDIAVMTNVTPEHLDYHRTFNRYRQAKMRLFKMASSEAKRGGQGIGIVNADDDSAGYFASLVPKCVSYGVNGGNIRATRIKKTAKGSEYYTRIDKKSYHIKVNIPGNFYVYNSLAAVATCHSLGLSKEQIEDGISSLAGVNGRMNHIDTDLGFDIIVDYAHTPDAYEKLLPDVKKITAGKLIVVCGAAGKRDTSKFPVMGELAGKYADIVILTEEDPAGPVRPLSELVAKGVRKAGKTDDKDLLFIDNRTKAIKKAVGLADKGDTILLLGMGHQKTIERADGIFEWNDEQAARDAVAELSKKLSN